MLAAANTTGGAGSSSRDSNHSGTSSSSDAGATSGGGGGGDGGGLDPALSLVVATPHGLRLPAYWQLLAGPFFRRQVGGRSLLRLYVCKRDLLSRTKGAAVYVNVW